MRKYLKIQVLVLFLGMILSYSCAIVKLVNVEPIIKNSGVQRFKCICLDNQHLVTYLAPHEKKLAESNKLQVIVGFKKYIPIESWFIAKEASLVHSIAKSALKSQPRDIFLAVCKLKEKIPNVKCLTLYNGAVPLQQKMMLDLNRINRPLIPLKSIDIKECEDSYFVNLCMKVNKINFPQDEVSLVFNEKMTNDYNELRKEFRVFETSDRIFCAYPPHKLDEKQFSLSLNNKEQETIIRPIKSGVINGGDIVNPLLWTNKDNNQVVLVGISVYNYFLKNDNDSLPTYFYCEPSQSIVDFLIENNIKCDQVDELGDDFNAALKKRNPQKNKPKNRKLKKTKNNQSKRTNKKKNKKKKRNF